MQEFHNSLQQFNDAVRTAIRRGAVQIVSNPTFAEMARRYYEEQEKPKKKPRHHDHLLQRHIRSPTHRSRRP